MLVSFADPHGSIFVSFVLHAGCGIAGCRGCHFVDVMIQKVCASDALGPAEEDKNAAGLSITLNSSSASTLLVELTPAEYK